jgi:hypothetical protein
MVLQTHPVTAHPTLSQSTHRSRIASLLVTALSSWQQLVPALSSWQKLAPAHSSWQQLVPALSSWQQLVPALSSWQQLVSALSSWQKLVPALSISSQPSLLFRNSSQPIPPRSSSFQIVQSFLLPKMGLLKSRRTYSRIHFQFML